MSNKTRKLTTLQKIKQILPIENADAIELIKFENVAWQCVAKKGEFKIGDLAIYFEIDSLIPTTNPIFNFLAKGGTKTVTTNGQTYTGYRLRTMKMRGVLSQGLALPLALFPKIKTNSDFDTTLNIVKYERLILNKDEVLGDFHSQTPKTDEERIQNLVQDWAKWQDLEFTATEKVDGSSCTIVQELDQQGKLVKRVIDELLLFAEGESKLASGVEREGLVFRSVKSIQNGNQLNRISFKAISNKYLLNGGE